MEHPEEDIILYDDEEKYDDVINEGEVDCIGVQISSREREYTCGKTRTTAG